MQKVCVHGKEKDITCLTQADGQPGNNDLSLDALLIRQHPEGLQIEMLHIRSNATQERCNYES